MMKMPILPPATFVALITVSSNRRSKFHIFRSILSSLIYFIQDNIEETIIFNLEYLYLNQYKFNLYSDENLEVYDEEEKVEADEKISSDLLLENEKITSSHQSQIVQLAKPSPVKQTKFLAIRVPFFSKIEIPDPIELEKCFRALGLRENMIKSF